MSFTGSAIHIKQRIPSGGLFAEKEWRIANAPIKLSERHYKILDSLGTHLCAFIRACDLLYRQSMNGKQPPWIAQWLNAGKPRELIEIANLPNLKNQIPAVLRPDLIVTEEGFALCEIDSLPGGIGLTAWLQQEYSAIGYPILGSPDGMKTAFHKLFPDGNIILADEGLDYRPEFEWLAGKDRVKHANEIILDGKPIYRFVEAFDWLHHPALSGSWNPTIPMTPPLKPHLEEKLWLALFHLKPLRSFWRRELGDKGVAFLENLIPQSWVVTPDPLPPHAVIPGLNVNHWMDVGDFSQKDRELVLKVSGFSPLAWGSRGVWIGQDLPTSEWKQAVEQALSLFDREPRLMMRFVKGAKISQEWITDTGEVHSLEGRVRLCPYYFIEDQKPVLAGALSTLCPADKKLIHGMSNAILSPLAA